MTPVRMLAAALLLPALILAAVGAVIGAIVRWRRHGMSESKSGSLLRVRTRHATPLGFSGCGKSPTAR
jgi:hypothetical protein